MKTLKITLLLVIIVSLFSCKSKKEAEELRTLNQQMNTQLENCNSLLNEYRTLVDDIENSIYSSLPDTDRPGQTTNFAELKNRLSNAIAEINNLLEEREQAAQTLRNRTSRVSSRISALESDLEEMKINLEQKDSLIRVHEGQIKVMNETIAARESDISELTGRIEALNTDLNEMTDQLHKVYYIAGTEDELRDQGIIEKTGGFLGFLGRVNTLDPNLDQSLLEEIDVREMTSFELNSSPDDLQLITAHPGGSYELEGINSDSVLLTITDSEKFWQISDYLVMVKQ